MAERNQPSVAIGGLNAANRCGPVQRATWSKELKEPIAGFPPKCVPDDPGSESDPVDWAERNRAVNSKMYKIYLERKIKGARQRMAQRRARNVAQQRALQLKGLLDDATRREVDAHAAMWKRRLLREFFHSRGLAFDSKKMSVKAMLAKYANSCDLHKMVVLQAEFEISLVEGIAERGSLKNSLRALRMASELAEGPLAQKNGESHGLAAIYHDVGHQLDAMALASRKHS